MPQIEVTFDIDANGILNVSAKDMATGKTQNITITASSGLSKDEVEKMVKEAQSHSDEDKKRRELVDLRNQADSLAYNLEKTAQGEPRQGRRRQGAGDRGGRGRGPQGHRTARTRTRSSRRWTASPPSSHELAESLYKARGAAARRRRTPGRPARRAVRGRGRHGRDDVVDAEYTVKN